MAALLSHCGFEVMCQLLGKASTLFCVRFSVRFKLSAGVAGTAVAFACIAAQVSAIGLSSKANMGMDKVCKFGECVMSRITFKNFCMLSISN